MLQIFFGSLTHGVLWTRWCAICLKTIYLQAQRNGCVIWWMGRSW